jgi:hypothetical protein
LCEVGIDARSCDLKPCEHPEWGIPHIQDNALNHLKGYDLGIGHPECTRLANSGVRWLLERPELMTQVKPAADFFNAFFGADIEKICLENPIQHKYARQYIRQYDQIVQPHYFGDKESKATCLWLVRLPKLVRTHWIPKEEIQQSVWKEAPNPDRKTNRARTFKGVANAMASQWS